MAETRGTAASGDAAPPLAPLPRPAVAAPRPGLLLLGLVFGFGAAAGVLAAFAGAGFLEGSLRVAVSAFLAALAVLAVAGALLVAFRRPILTRLYGQAEAEVTAFADPLAEAARAMLARDPEGATGASHRFVALVLARASWVLARRWVIGSLTALIAALAALAGTALLFQQNRLLAAQSGLLDQQNRKIEEQTLLLLQGVELAEAARNAALAPAIAEIGDSLGAAAEAAQPDDTIPFVNVLDPATDLPRGLILRIAALSRAFSPYRFLDPGLRPADPHDRMRVAMQRRRADLPEAYARMAAAYGWTDRAERARLIDRPASPERGQLLSVLVLGGVRNLEILNVAGLDLTFARLHDGDLSLMSAQQGRMAFADFTGSVLVEADLGGATLENARLAQATLLRASFAVVGPAEVRPPIPPASAPLASFLNGIDFSRAVIRDSRFDGAWMLAANLDGAVILGGSFRRAQLGAATLRRTLLAGVDFTDAGLRSADFEGAVVFGEGALAALERAAEPGSFAAADWRAEPVTLDDVMASPTVSNAVDPVELQAITGGAAPFRLTRAAQAGGGAP